LCTRVTADQPPILRPKSYGEPSLFEARNLLREGRRQRELPDLPVPPVCLLDPDGDVVRHLRELWIAHRGEYEVGIVPCAVGAPYAVLVAEELHASGCELIVSITSAGRILPLGELPYFTLIERAWRDEGTSLHYLPPTEWAHMRPQLVTLLTGAFDGLAEPIRIGRSWTTDAPFRETRNAIAKAEHAGIHAVEMEAAALYAYATAQRRDIVCVAHVTNNMATGGRRLRKGHGERYISNPCGR
jgi:uridine phosphorylase